MRGGLDVGAGHDQAPLRGFRLKCAACRIRGNELHSCETLAILMRMSSLPGLDVDLLRTFALIAEEGSFTRAAERVGRTQSAVSLQVKRLEEIVGHRGLCAW